MSSDVVRCPLCDNQMPANTEACFVCGTPNPYFSADTSGDGDNSPSDTVESVAASLNTSERETFADDYDFSAMFAQHQSVQEEVEESASPQEAASGLDLSSLFSWGDDTTEANTEDAETAAPIEPELDDEQVTEEPPAGMPEQEAVSVHDLAHDDSPLDFSGHDDANQIGIRDDETHHDDHDEVIAAEPELDLATVEETDLQPEAEDETKLNVIADEALSDSDEIDLVAQSSYSAADNVIQEGAAPALEIEIPEAASDEQPTTYVAPSEPDLPPEIEAHGDSGDIDSVQLDNEHGPDYESVSESTAVQVDQDYISESISAPEVPTIEAAAEQDDAEDAPQQDNLESINAMVEAEDAYVHEHTEPDVTPEEITTPDDVVTSDTIDDISLEMSSHETETESASGVDDPKSEPKEGDALPLPDMDHFDTVSDDAYTARDEEIESESPVASQDAGESTVISLDNDGDASQATPDTDHEPEPINREPEIQVDDNSADEPDRAMAESPADEEIYVAAEASNEASSGDETDSDTLVPAPDVEAPVAIGDAEDVQEIDAEDAQSAESVSSEQDEAPEQDASEQDVSEQETVASDAMSAAEDIAALPSEVQETGADIEQSETVSHGDESNAFHYAAQSGSPTLTPPTDEAAIGAEEVQVEAASESESQSADESISLHPINENDVVLSAPEYEPSDPLTLDTDTASASESRVGEVEEPDASEETLEAIEAGSALQDSVSAGEDASPSIDIYASPETAPEEFPLDLVVAGEMLDASTPEQHDAAPVDGRPTSDVHEISTEDAEPRAVPVPDMEASDEAEPEPESDRTPTFTYTEIEDAGEAPTEPRGAVPQFEDGAQDTHYTAPDAEPESESIDNDNATPGAQDFEEAQADEITTASANEADMSQVDIPEEIKEPPAAADLPTEDAYAIALPEEQDAEPVEAAQLAPVQDDSVGEDPPPAIDIEPVGVEAESDASDTPLAESQLASQSDEEQRQPRTEAEDRGDGAYAEETSTETATYHMEPPAPEPNLSSAAEVSPVDIIVPSDGNLTADVSAPVADTGWNLDLADLFAVTPTVSEQTESSNAPTQPDAASGESYAPPFETSVALPDAESSYQSDTFSPYETTASASIQPSAHVLDKQERVDTPYSATPITYDYGVVSGDDTSVSEQDQDSLPAPFFSMDALFADLPPEIFFSSPDSEFQANEDIASPSIVAETDSDIADPQVQPEWSGYSFAPTETVTPTPVETYVEVATPLSDRSIVAEAQVSEAQAVEVQPAEVNNFPTPVQEPAPVEQWPTYTPDAWQETEAPSVTIEAQSFVYMDDVAPVQRQLDNDFMDATASFVESPASSEADSAPLQTAESAPILANAPVEYTLKAQPLSERAQSPQVWTPPVPVQYGEQSTTEEDLWPTYVPSAQTDAVVVPDIPIATSGEQFQQPTDPDAAATVAESQPYATETPSAVETAPQPLTDGGPGYVEDVQASSVIDIPPQEAVADTGLDLSDLFSHIEIDTSERRIPTPVVAVPEPPPVEVASVPVVPDVAPVQATPPPNPVPQTVMPVTITPYSGAQLPGNHNFSSGQGSQADTSAWQAFSSGAQASASQQTPPQEQVSWAQFAQAGGPDPYATGVGPTEPPPDAAALQAASGPRPQRGTPEYDAMVRAALAQRGVSYNAPSPQPAPTPQAQPAQAQPSWQPQPGQPRPKPGTPEYEEMVRAALAARGVNTGSLPQQPQSQPQQQSYQAPQQQPQSGWQPGQPRPKPGTPEYDEMVRAALAQRGVSSSPMPQQPQNQGQSAPQSPQYSQGQPRPKPGTPEYEEMVRRALNERREREGK